MHLLMVDRVRNPFTGIVMLAPLVKPWGWGRGVWTYRFGRFFLTSVKRQYIENSNNHKFVKFIHHVDPLQSEQLPVAWVGAMKRWIDRFEILPELHFMPLIIQGEADRTVDWKYNIKAIARKFNKTKLVYLPRAKHHLANESPDHLTEIFSEISHYLAIQERGWSDDL